MDEVEQVVPDKQIFGRPTQPRKLAAAGLAAGLLGGGAAGMLMSNAPLSGAAAVSVAQGDEPADNAEDSAADDMTEPEKGEREKRRAEHLAEALAPLVENGTIDQDQADAVTAAILDAAPEHPHRPRHPWARMRFEAAAEAIGVEPRVLLDAIRDGSTIAEVALERGVDVQVVIDAMVADATERVNQAVASGRITREEASERLAGLTERVIDHVNNGLPGHGHGEQGPYSD